MIIYRFLQFAGLAQIVLAMGSLTIPGILNWRGELIKTAPLIRQMFWVYAAYIFVINLSFGLVSIFFGMQLLGGSALSRLLIGFIAVYWLSRVLIQFTYFDRKNFPVGRWYRVGEALLVTVFLFLCLVYGYAFWFNLKFSKS